MIEQVKQFVDECALKLQKGELTEELLRGLFTRLVDVPHRSESGKVERAITPNLRQNLLYLVCSTSSISSPVVGMALFENGVLSDGPEEEWPYAKVIDALNDGWRIIQFPIIVLHPMEMGQRYVPVEFILEKMIGGSER